MIANHLTELEDCLYARAEKASLSRSLFAVPG
jgi:hypothetical protein